MCAGAPLACPLRRFRNSPAFRRAVVQREPGGAKGVNQRFFSPNNTPSDLRLKQTGAHAADGFTLAIRRCSKYHIYTRIEYASTIYCGCVFLSKKPCQAIGGSSNAACALNRPPCLDQAAHAGRSVCAWGEAGCYMLGFVRGRQSSRCACGVKQVEQRA